MPRRAARGVAAALLLAACTASPSLMRSHGPAGQLSVEVAHEGAAVLARQHDLAASDHPADVQNAEVSPEVSLEQELQEEAPVVGALEESGESENAEEEMDASVKEDEDMDESVSVNEEEESSDNEDEDEDSSGRPRGTANGINLNSYSGPKESCALRVLNPGEAAREYSSRSKGDCRYDRSMLGAPGCEHWAASMLAREEWLQFDLGTVKSVTGAVVQGGGSLEKQAGWVKTYKVLHSDDASRWTNVGTFDGNTDVTGRVQAQFKHSIKARYVRLVPLTWHGEFIRMRAALVTCKAGDCEATEEENLPETARTYSSFYHDELFPYGSSKLGGHYGWRPAQSVVGEWLQLDAGTVMRVTGVTTQGAHGGAWVTQYKVQHSSDAKSWSDIPGVWGNQDSDSANDAMFHQPVQARYIRIFPLVWRGHISIRAALLVCDNSPESWTRMVAQAMSKGQELAVMAGLMWTKIANPYIKKWLGLYYTPRPAAGSNAEFVATAARSFSVVWGKIRFALPDPQDSLCRLGMTAYTGTDFVANKPMIYLCKDFYSNEVSNLERTGLLLHEALHVFGATDYSYKELDSMRLPDAVKAFNANSYIFLVLDVVATCGPFRTYFRHLYNQFAPDLPAVRRRLPRSEVREANCNTMKGKLCKKDGGICIMQADTLGQSCADYCEANDMYCLGAFMTNVCPKQGWTWKGTRNQHDCWKRTQQAICWCKPAEGATYAISSSTTWSPTGQRSR